MYGPGVDPMNPSMTQPFMNPMMTQQSAMMLANAHGHWATMPSGHHAGHGHGHKRKRKGLLETLGIVHGHGHGGHGHDDHEHHEPHHEHPPVGFFAPAHPPPTMHHPNQMMSTRFFDTGQPPLFWHEDSESSSEEEWCAGFADDLDAHPMRIYLWITGVLVIAFSILLLATTWVSLARDDFQTFSALAAENGYLSFCSFWMLLLVFVFMAILGSMLAGVGYYIGWKESKPVLRALSTVEIGLAVALIFFVIFIWFLSFSCTADVVRTANVICQNTSEWGCSTGPSIMGPASVVDTWSDPSSTTAAAGGDAGLTTGNESTQGDEEFEAFLADAGNSAEDSNASDGDAGSQSPAVTQARARLRRLGAAPPRRLDATQAAGAANFLNDRQRFPTQGLKCARVAQICVPPVYFNAATSCVCNGQSLVDTTITTTTWTTSTTSTLTQTTSTSTNSTTSFSTTTTTSSTSTQTTSTSTTTTSLGGSALEDIPGAVQPTPAAAADSALNDVPPSAKLRRALDGVPAGPAQDLLEDAGPVLFELERSAERRLYQVPTTWQGHTGAYCEDWDNTGTEWCFANPGHACNADTASADGQFRKSSGPCTSAVESRSQYVFNGKDALTAPMVSAVLLALCLLAVAAGGLMIKWPEHVYIDAPHHAPSDSPGVPMKDPLEEKFQQAQAIAQRKIKKETPNDFRLALFAYYRQATEGDVRGQRPNFFASHDRAKYDYWAKIKGMSRKEAIEKYCELVSVIGD